VGVSSIYIVCTAWLVVNDSGCVLGIQQTLSSSPRLHVVIYGKYRLKLVITRMLWVCPVPHDTTCFGCHAL
jgi:hypothetical protein